MFFDFCGEIPHLWVHSYNFITSLPLLAVKSLNLFLMLPIFEFKIFHFVWDSRQFGFILNPVILNLFFQALQSIFRIPRAIYESLIILLAKNFSILVSRVLRLCSVRSHLGGDRWLCVRWLPLLARFTFGKASPALTTLRTPTFANRNGGRLSIRTLPLCNTKPWWLSAFTRILGAAAQDLPFF